MEEAKQWYKEVLELEEIYTASHYSVFKVGTGETPITVGEGEVRPSSTTTILFSEALEETRLKLLDREVEAGPVLTDEGVTYFQFTDPDGNPFEVCHVPS
ncbi:VOC family protein [Rossellomorea aquimaris]|nr:VOC family protein [Rossellomorea aquimaris]MCA1054438.1 VOC family protein [Rossellomorea aquimaris]